MLPTDPLAVSLDEAAPAVRMRSAISSAGGVTGAPPPQRDHTYIKTACNHCSARSCVASAAGGYVLSAYRTSEIGLILMSVADYTSSRSWATETGTRASVAPRYVPVDGMPSVSSGLN